MDFSGGSDDKESACNSGDLGSVLGSGRFSWKGNAYALQYSCLENSTDGGAWWATVHGITKSRTPLSALSQCTSVFNILRDYQNSLLQRVYQFTLPPAVYGSLSFSQHLFAFFTLAVLMGTSLWL